VRYPKVLLSDVAQDNSTPAGMVDHSAPMTMVEWARWGAINMTRITRPFARAMEDSDHPGGAVVVIGADEYSFPN
jgi:hypothetical protein